MKIFGTVSLGSYFTGSYIKKECTLATRNHPSVEKYLPQVSYADNEKQFSNIFHLSSLLNSKTTDLCFQILLKLCHNDFPFVFVLWNYSICLFFMIC